MIRAFQRLVPLLVPGLLFAGCLEADPHVQQRAEEDRRYVESRLEAMETELSESLVNLPAERILEISGPEVMARQARVAHAEARGILMEDLRAALTVELDLRCQEMCESGMLHARRADRKEVEAGRNKALEEIKELKKDLELERSALDKISKDLEAEKARLAEQNRNILPMTCSPTGDAAFQAGLYGDALSKYRAALKDYGDPECHRVLALVYGALGYKKNQAKHLKDYLHLMRSKLEPQQVAKIQAELRAAKR